MSEEIKNEEALEENKEKKENGFTKFFKNAKKSINDSILEGNIRGQWNKENKEYTICTKNETFSNTVYGKIDGDKLTIFGVEEIKPYAVIIEDGTEKAYYVISSIETSVSVTYEGATYERKGMIIALDENTEEVNVVKAGKRYFIYKGE